MRLLSLSCLFLLWGCSSRNNFDSESLDRDAESVASTCRECSWEEVSDWLASDPDCHRKDDSRGYEWLVAEKDRWGMRPEVWFSPRFGKWAPQDADGLTILCQNWTRDLLPIKGFPGSCKGIELSGPFDMSNAVIGDSVEYFHSEAHGISDWPQYYEAYDDLPRFSGTSKLKYLSVKRFNKGDGCRRRLRIPCLDMTRFSKMDNLEEVDVRVEGLALHPEVLLNNNKLCSLFVWEFYDYLADSNEGRASADSGSSGFQKYSIDDASFEEFIKRDFAGIKRMRVEIALSKVQTWNIARLADLHLDVLSISTKNCMITGAEAFQGGLGANWLNIDMDISRDR